MQISCPDNAAHIQFSLCIRRHHRLRPVRISFYVSPGIRRYRHAPDRTVSAYLQRQHVLFSLQHASHQTGSRHQPAERRRDDRTQIMSVPRFFHQIPWRHRKRAYLRIRRRRSYQIIRHCSAPFPVCLRLLRTQDFPFTLFCPINTIRPLSGVTAPCVSASAASSKTSPAFSNSVFICSSRYPRW